MWHKDGGHIILVANGSRAAEPRERSGYSPAGLKVQNKILKNMNWRDFKYEDAANDACHHAAALVFEV